MAPSQVEPPRVATASSGRRCPGTGIVTRQFFSSFTLLAGTVLDPGATRAPEPGTGGENRLSTSDQGYGPDHASGFSFDLHHVLLAVPRGSENACRAFYVDVLGMVELRKPPALAARGGLWVRADGLEIHLGVEEDFRPARKAHPGIRVPDLDALARHLAAHGVAPRWDDDFPGHRRFYADDPVGNRLEFLQRDGSVPGW